MESQESVITPGHLPIDLAIERPDNVQRKPTHISYSDASGGHDDSGTADSIMGVPLQEIERLNTGPLQGRLYTRGIRALGWWASLREPSRKGCLSRIVNDRLFTSICALVIVANSAFMVYTSNTRMANLGDENLGAEVGELMFLSWYIVELSLKMAVHRLYFFVGADWSWNLFDLALVVVAIQSRLMGFFLSSNGGSSSNTTVLRSLRVLRLAKVLRAVRLLRYLAFFSSMRLILRSVIGSWISLFWSLAMIFFACYLFSVGFVQSLTDFLQARGDGVDPLLKQDILDIFGTVETGLLTLFKATFGGRPWDVYYRVLSQTETQNTVAFIFFIGFMQISVLNIMTAVFVDLTTRLAKPDTQEEAKEKHLKEKEEAKELRRLICGLDTEHKGTINISQFQELVDNSHLRHCLAVLGLDLRNSEEVLDALGFSGGNTEVGIDDFVQGCMRMRGGATGLAQQSLIAEARRLRCAQTDIGSILSKKLDRLNERLKWEHSSKSSPF